MKPKLKNQMKKQLLILCLAIIAINAYSQIPPYVPTSGLVGWWPFNGNANDESGNGNNGTVNGATLTADRFGNANSAYYFSGASCATRIDASVNTSSIQTGLTFSYWFLQSGNGCLGPRTFEFYSPGQGPGFLVTQNFGITSGLGYTTGSNQNVSLGFPPTALNQWAHIVFTNNGAMARVFKDGVLVDSVAVTGSVVLYNTMCIGRMDHPAYDAHQGDIDDIGIWNRALTQQEVTSLFQGLTGINELSADNLFSVFPNPGNGIFLIKSEIKNSSIEIVNVLGEKVYATKINSAQSEIDLSKQPQGIYFIKLISEQGTATKKLIIQ